MSDVLATVVLSTYNTPRSLDLVLHGYRWQSEKSFEIVVADDGSTPETKEMLVQHPAAAELPIRHVWQEDQGFRKCRALNLAIRASRSDYLIFSDGDCIPRADFVGTHLALRKPGAYLSGAMFRMAAPVSAAVTPEAIQRQDPFCAAWLRAQGQAYRPKQFWKLTRNARWARFCERLSNAHAGWNGANSSCYKADAVRINGFDERLVYGGEDREFGFRLDRAGLSGIKVRYRAALAHLDHPRGYENEAGWQHNRKLISQGFAEKLLRTPFGLEQHG